jgi:hypothetical protein
MVRVIHNFSKVHQNIGLYVGRGWDGHVRHSESEGCSAQVAST